MSFLPLEHAGHAKSLIASYDLSQIDGIIVSSGDGLIYEVSTLAQTRMWKNDLLRPKLHLTLLHFLCTLA